MKFTGKVGNEQIVLNFGGDPDHRLDTGIVFRIRHYWEIRKAVSTDCAARRCSAGHALAGIGIATVTSLRYVTSPWRRYALSLLVLLTDTTLYTQNEELRQLRSQYECPGNFALQMALPPTWCSTSIAVNV